MKRILNVLKFKYKDCYWIIDNSYGLVNDINIGSFKTVQTFDFENLFTNIPMDNLKHVLCLLYDMVKEDLNEVFNEDFSFEELCKFCLFNNFIITGDSIYLQINGIGMGTSYSSTAANLFLFFYEYNFCLNNEVPWFTYRYIDDLIVFNYDDNFADISKHIYPNCLSLKCTNSDYTIANFLDLRIDLSRTPTEISIYDKRKDFNFKVISYIHWSSNINKRIFSNIILGQIFRFYKICNNKLTFNRQLYYFFGKLYYDNNLPYNFINKYISASSHLY